MCVYKHDIEESMSIKTWFFFKKNWYFVEEIIDDQMFDKK